MPENAVAIALAPDYLPPRGDFRSQRWQPRRGTWFRARLSRTMWSLKLCRRVKSRRQCTGCTPFFTLIALNGGDFHNAQENSTEPANALFSLKLRSGL